MHSIVEYLPTLTDLRIAAGSLSGHTLLQINIGAGHTNIRMTRSLSPTR